MKNDSKRQTKGKLSRREFIKAGVAGLGAAAVGGLPHRVFGQGPAIIKGTKLSIKLKATSKRSRRTSRIHRHCSSQGVPWEDRGKGQVRSTQGAMASNSLPSIAPAPWRLSASR